MQTKFEQLLDLLINEENEKANELFHEIVVEKSRTIYENLIAEEDDDKDEKAKKDEKADESVEENFGGESVIEIGGDATDDLIGDVEFGDETGDEGGEEDDMAFGGGDEMGGEGDVEDRVQDLEDALEELKAEFEALMGAEEGEGHHDGEEADAEFGDEEGEEETGDEEEEGEEESFIREYTEKVGGATYDKYAKGGDNGQNTKSIVAGKNDMGGTAFKLGANEGQGGGEAGAPGGQLKGNGVLKGAPKEDNAGNQNVPGGMNSKQFFKKDSKGHGAEKKGSGESAGNTKSPVAPSHAK